eukprot:Gb_39362 [translate_table: standard]
MGAVFHVKVLLRRPAQAVASLGGSRSPAKPHGGATSHERPGEGVQGPGPPRSYGGKMGAVERWNTSRIQGKLAEAPWDTCGKGKIPKRGEKTKGGREEMARLLKRNSLIPPTKWTKSISNDDRSSHVKQQGLLPSMLQKLSKTPLLQAKNSKYSPMSQECDGKNE